MSTEHTVPWRTIWATIASVVLTLLLLLLVRELQHVLVWIVLAAFLALVLDAPVATLDRRTPLGRLPAAVIVYLAGFVVIVGAGAILLAPLVDQGQQLADDLPRFVEEARAGQGPVGDLVTRFELEKRLAEQQDTIQENVSRLGTQSLHVLGVIGTTIAALITILVLSFLMLLEGPRLLAAGATALPASSRGHVARVAGDCGRAVTGYMAGNLVISVIAGGATYLFLWITGVPFRGLLAIWVGIADLIPLVGATLGAAVVILVATLHSPVAGLAALIFFIVYQQIENHVVQPVIQARTVKLSPLTVLVSVLLGVELAGILGALLAIPVAGMVSVIARDVWDVRGGFKVEPTVGADELPADEVPADQLPAGAATDDG